MIDIVGNLHLHTTTSDGTGTHDEVAKAAIRAGLDFIVYTDHNVWVNDIEGWYHDCQTGGRVLRLMGQEVNDQTRQPELNHLLCHFVQQDLTQVAHQPQTLIDTVRSQGGTTFLAHPLERPGYGKAKSLYPWINWEVTGYTGLELWNAMTDVKWTLRTVPRGFLGAYFPPFALTKPFPELLAKWDELLCNGQKVVAIGNSDAHAISISALGLTRTIFPYQYLFQTVNTHLLLNQPLSTNVLQARNQIYKALIAGHCYVAYDLIGQPKGFSFTATSNNQTVIMGDTLFWNGAGELQVNLPAKAKLRLIHNGRLVVEQFAQDLVYPLTQPGVYRLEAYRKFWFQERGWIFSNPIYVV